MLLALSFVLSACAGHASRTEGARTALDEGRPKAALKLLNDELDVDGPDKIPENVGGENALLMLDRAMVLQAVASRSEAREPREYAWSSRDLEIADKQIEVLDFSRNAVHDIGKYLFSDETGPYKAPTYEKLMINTMNMVNYLVRGDLTGAKVEARRLAVMQRYVSEHEGHGESLLGPGSYFAGFTFEKSGDAQEALLYYDEALQYGSYASLAGPVQRLAASTTYRSPRIRALLEGSGAPEGGQSAAQNDDSAEILVVISFGRVPPKVAKRIPIGLALTYVSGWMSPTDINKANYLAAQGLVTWINFPDLGRPHGAYAIPEFALDGSMQGLEGVVAVDQEAKKAWDGAKGSVLASAITRMIARIVAGEAIRRSTNDQLLGAVLSLGTQATLTALDTPDTRSWSTLPARIAIGRVRVKPGTHVIEVEARGVRKRQTIAVRPGGWAVVDLTVLN